MPRPDRWMGTSRQGLAGCQRPARCARAATSSVGDAPWPIERYDGAFEGPLNTLQATGLLLVAIWAQPADLPEGRTASWLYGALNCVEQSVSESLSDDHSGPEIGVYRAALPTSNAGGPAVGRCL